jgi:hypothetical protein
MSRCLRFSGKHRHGMVFRLAGCQRAILPKHLGTELQEGVLADTPVRITAAERHPDLARGDAYLSADTQQLQANSFTLGSRPPGPGKELTGGSRTRGYKQPPTDTDAVGWPVA